ncbi:MAG: hypothetical protein JJT77_09510 [Crocinitomicaceae bacterium]|nr:hypothetical protein [Crocinitomicaceae bacterium]
MIQRILIVVYFSSLGGMVLTQAIMAELDPKMNETSALLCFGEEFITINDSGNEAELYFFDTTGTILHTTKILGAKNVDWEALATDGNKRLFIGDIGNNKNQRKSFTIYQVNLDSARQKTAVSSEKTTFFYPDQSAFPPEKNELYFDAEAMFYKNDSLFMITKNRTIPFDGIARVYGLAVDGSAKQKAKRYPDLKLPATTWMEDSVTDAFLQGDSLYILTYGKVYLFHLTEDFQFEVLKIVEFDAFTQKEGIAVCNDKLFITDEKNKFLGKAHLYQLDF